MNVQVRGALTIICMCNFNGSDDFYLFIYTNMFFVDFSILHFNLKYKVFFTVLKYIAKSFPSQVGRHLQYFVPQASFSYSDVFIAVELIKQLVKLDHYSVCQLSFTQQDFSTRAVNKENCGLKSFVKRIHGLILRHSFKKSSISNIKGINASGYRSAIHKIDSVVVNEL